MRILFTHAPSDLYGASRSLLRLSTRLARDGNKVCVVLSDDGPLASALKASAVTVVIYPRLAVVDRRKQAAVTGLFELGINLVLSLVQLWRLTGTFKPDIIHTNTALILTSGIVAKVRGIPHIWHIREVFADFKILWKWYEPLIASFSTRIICVSRTVAGQFTLSHARRKLCVLHNGIPKDEFSDVPASRVENFRCRYGLNGNPLIGLVGRIKIGRKGQDILLKAAAGIKAKFPAARFLLIGSPFQGNEDHLKIVQNLIHELRLHDTVIYTGDVDDIKAAYAALDISVQASVLPEAFSGVVVESMAMGKPVVASNCGSAREQIDDGKTGILVDPGDPSQLEAALTKLLNDENLRRELGRNARKRFMETFEFETFYQQMCTLYSSVSQKPIHPQ